MTDVSLSSYSNQNKDNNNITDLKIYPTSFPTKKISNTVYNINTIHKKTNSSNINSNITFKITEKECSDINSIVRKSVEKINDLLNSKEFNNNNFSKTFKRSSKNCFAEMLEKEREKEKEKILKSKTLKESGIKTNFTFNINNFINVPNDHGKNESINTNKKTERYEEEDEGHVEQVYSEKNIHNNCKAKSNQKGSTFSNNNRIKNNNYINYGTNRHNNEKLFRNCVRKKKLFDDGMNINNINYNNNINIVNFTNRPKNKKTKKIETKEDKDKSITVNIKNKRNDNRNYINDNFMVNKDKILSSNHNTLNNSIKTNTKDNNKNNNLLKYSISEDINNSNNSKLSTVQKNNIINLNNFAPNIININSLSDNKNLKNIIMNNNNNNKQNNNNKPNINSLTKNNSKKSKEKEKRKIIISPQKENTKNSKDNDDIKIKKANSRTIPLNNPINNNEMTNNNNSIKSSFSNKIIIDTRKTNNDSLNNIIDINNEKKITINRPALKKEPSNNIKKCGYSCDYLNKNAYNYTENVHKVLNRLYSKEFPNKVRTNNMMKLMLFLNEYLINYNLLDDYYDINNRKKLDIFSKFLVEQVNVDYPQEDDVNIDKMVNSVKKIQRMWRKKKIEKFIGHNSEENELKKMIINKYIRKAGFKIKKIIGLFNSLVEDFNNIGNEQETEEMFYNIQQIIKKKLTPYEKNNLYKEYINSIIYMK